MHARKLLFVAVFAVAPEAAALADPPPFGPISDASFYFVNGKSIEQPKDNCVNGDVLRVRGPGLGNAKSVDVSPKTPSYPNTKNRDKYGCEAPDCYQLFIQLSSKDTVAQRTVTITHADGRSVTTTFDVTSNAGRCDEKKGSQK